MRANPKRSALNGLCQLHEVQWNFMLQKQLPGKVFCDIGYVGSKGTALPFSFDANRPVAVVNPSDPGVAPLASRRPYQGFAGINATKAIRLA